MNPTAGDFVPGRAHRPPLEGINTQAAQSAFRHANTDTAYNPQLINAPLTTPEQRKLVYKHIGQDELERARLSRIVNFYQDSPHPHFADRTSVHPAQPNTYPLYQGEFVQSHGAYNRGYPIVRDENSARPQTDLNSQKGQTFLHGTNSAAAPHTSSVFYQYPVEIETVVRFDAEDNISEYTVISPHYLERMPGMKGEKAPVFNQNTHPLAFKRFAMSGEVEMKQAFPGAYETVSALNPDFFVMPLGTRVINIKTEFKDNVEFAIRTGKWSTLGKVSERIMQVWNARKFAEEKVLFLFAINGSKQYCGLAEMSGPWDSDKQIDGFIESTSGAGNKGTIPLTWIYVKNVPYEKFAGLVQGENRQPVTNMWNGMHIESAAARYVIERYVSQPHFTNILAWPAGQENIQPRQPRAPNSDWQTPRYHNQSGGNQVVPHARALRNGRGGNGGGSYNGRTGHPGRRDVTNPYESMNWRNPNNQPPSKNNDYGEMNENEPTPRAPRTTGGYHATPARFDGPADTAPTPQAGRIVQCYLDANGNYVPVEPSPELGGVPLSAASFPREDPFHNGQQALFRGQPQQTGVWAAPSQTGQGLGISADDFPPLSHAASGANMRSQQGGHRGPSAAPALQHAASVAHFAQPGAQQQSLRHAASVAAFHQQPMVPGNLTGAKGKQPNVILPDKHLHANSSKGAQAQAAASAKSTSDTSYPSIFKSADSMAGYDPRYKAPKPTQPTQPAPSLLLAQPLPTGKSWVPSESACLPEPLRPRKVEETPTHAPGSKVQQMADWIEKTPTQHDFTISAPADVALIPVEKQATYYHLMADRAGFQAKIRTLGATDDQEYFRYMAKVSEIDNMIRQLSVDPGCVGHSETPCKNVTRGSSEADSTTIETGSREKYNISPVRNAKGEPLDSVSRSGEVKDKNGMPVPKRTNAGYRALNAPYDKSIGAEIKAAAERLYPRPPSSVDVSHHVSPPSGMDWLLNPDAGSDLTFSLSDEIDMKSESGGARLEG